MNHVRRIAVPAVAAVLAVVTALTGAPAAGATTRDPSAFLPTLTEVRSARIKLADLPAAYRRDLSPDSDSSSTSTSNDPVCSRKLEALNSGGSGTGAPRKAEARFRDDKTVGPFVTSNVGVWRTKTPAVEGMAGIRSLLRSCDQWTETDTDGTKATVHLSRLAMPSLGSDRIAFRARITVRQGALSVSVRGDMALVRVRNAVTFVTVLSFGAPEGVNLVDLARLSTTRLAAII